MSREAVTALCRGVVDYAGTFPPAALELNEAIDNFARYRDGDDAWMLHRFVVFARDLDAFARFAPARAGWPLSVVCRNPGDVDRARAGIGESGVIESVETAVETVSEWDTFIERPFPIESCDLGAIQERGAMLKIRLGGASIPPASDVAQVLSSCAQSGLALKATAGLHQALRSTTHGFVNLALAATLARDGGDVAEIEALVDEIDPSAFELASDAATWRNRRFDVAAITEGRKLFRSFGSCSFEEPIESLDALIALTR